MDERDEKAAWRGIYTLWFIAILFALLHIGDELEKIAKAVAK